MYKYIFCWSDNYIVVAHEVRLIHEKLAMEPGSSVKIFLQAALLLLPFVMYMSYIMQIYVKLVNITAVTMYTKCGCFIGIKKFNVWGIMLIYKRTRSNVFIAYGLIIINHHAISQIWCFIHLPHLSNWLLIETATSVFNWSLYVKTDSSVSSTYSQHRWIVQWYSKILLLGYYVDLKKDQK